MTVETAIEDFLETFPCMSLKSSSSLDYIIEGDFPVVAQYHNNADTLVNRVFRLSIVVPINYPDAIPIVYEIGAQIPKSPDFHKNDDSSLCLGAPLALLRQLSEDASLVAFANACIVPHLASAILKKERGIPFLQGELKHYDEGLEENFFEYFGINIPLEAVPIIFARLGEKKRKANKRLCPCGQNRKLGALLLVLWDEAPRNEKQERKNISKRQKNIEHGGENSYHAQCYVFEVLENYQKAVRQSSPDLESSLR